MQKSNVIRLRLTDLEKADWQKAAGGARLTSAWIRAVCNAAAEVSRGGGLAGTADEQHPEPTDPEARPPIPNEKPLIVADSIEREMLAAVESLPTNKLGEGERREELSESSTSLPATQPSARRDSPSPKQCARWMHHRPGTYCGACKKVIKK